MKIEELMIGDLVRTAKDVCFPKGTIVQVRSIDGDNRIREKKLIGCATCISIDDPYKMSYGVWVEYLEPIPLTPEILEKNGFSKEIITNDDSNDYYTSYHWNPTPQYPSDGIWLYPTLSGYAFDSIISEIKIKYVHELQHLLHLCGIDKEITLSQL